MRAESSVTGQLEELRSRLREAAEPEFAAGVRNFFREAVDPYGVRSEKLHAIERILYRELKNWPKAKRDELMVALWESGKLEEGVIVSHVYRRFSKEFGEREFQMFERWLNRYVHNWAHCDGVASWLLAGAIRNRPQLIERLAAWTKSKNRWKRRAAAVALLHEAKAGRHTESIFEIGTMLRHDPDDMVQKGVGWIPEGSVSEEAAGGSGVSGRLARHGAAAAVANRGREDDSARSEMAAYKVMFVSSTFWP